MVKGDVMAEKLLDFVEKRKNNIEQKRRNFERILFKNMLGAYTTIDKGGVIYPVDLINISQEGCLFQVPWNGKKESLIEEGSEMTLRFYFTKKSYIPVVLTIKRGLEQLADGMTYMQYGCEFDRSMPSFEALEGFINFMEKFAEHSTIDKGDSRAMFF